jgi:hypothetical protein
MATKNENKEKLNFALGRENYKLLGIGFIIIVIGFLLMLGGKSKDPNEDNSGPACSPCRIYF